MKDSTIQHLQTSILNGMCSSNCYAIQALRENKSEQSLAPVEHARDHSTTNVPCQGSRVEACLEYAACLAKFVASRESKSVCDGEDKCNGCDPVVSTHSPRHPTELNRNIPTSVSQRKWILTIATIARATQRAGCAYNASQKNRLSVGVTTFPPGSLGCGALSNTQCESPLEPLTSFHHLKPTSRRPATFLR
jgi:hypothetical protein